MSQELLEPPIKSDEEEYDEEEDNDFVLDDSVKHKEEESDYSETEEDVINNRKYAKLESETGGLIKTRNQRANEVLEETRRSTVNKSQSETSKSAINSIWEELNNKGSKSVTSTKPDSKVSENESTTNGSPLVTSKNEKGLNELKDQKIKIKRTYEFAGETITEEKLVDINSQEAKAHLNSTKIISGDLSEDVNKNNKSLPSNLRRKRKRASLLDAVITNSSKAKLSTLEKSRLDWASYVDKNKINDELKYKNKDGYLEKQDFLNRVDSKQDQIARRSSKK